jgi:competence protein ComFC
MNMAIGDALSFRKRMISATKGLKAAGSSVLDIVYPRSCEGCGSRMEQDGYLCWDCLCTSEKLSRPYCEKCGDPVDGLVEGSYECSWCRRSHPLFSTARSVFRYRGAAVQVIQQLKYAGGVHLVGDVADYMAGAARSVFGKVRFDLVVGVPLHARKERERGYNQAGLLADAVASRLRVDGFNGIVRRMRDTVSQTELKSVERARNVNGAFCVDDPDWLFSKHVLLVDDVITTGATVNEVSSTLIKAGAASVNVISFARG